MTDPLALFPAMLAPFEGPRAFHICDWTNDGVQSRWIPTDDFAGLERVLRSSLAFECDLTLSAVPYADSGSRRVQAWGSVLFVRTETGESVKRLAAFDPPPTIILQEGKTNRMTAFWALQGRLPADDIERANRRLSYALHTAPKWCEPSFRFAPPGSVLRAGRSRPIPVVVAEQSEQLYPVSMTRPLKDRPKPDPTKWGKA